MMGRSQREKGKRGERLAAQAITKLTGIPMRRGVQYQGGPDSPDVLGIPGMHLEVKFVERESVRKWMAQAVSEAGDDVPVVLHKVSNREWLVTLQLERINEFTERLAEAMAEAFPKVGPADLPG